MMLGWAIENSMLVMTTTTSYPGRMPKPTAAAEQRIVTQLRHTDADERDRWNLFARAHNQSLSEFIREAVEEKIESSGGKLSALAKEANSLLKKNKSRK